ncbi:MAG: 50S ribosomal protein L11 methyltransferase [Desulfotignum sp.]|nr:50S ribosomal protein L11 methyltransferase [Desulfotignum sp.]MCF8126594.1 50S ribosomal protein L11 methyltransferase [Desulfotignum sp.]
MKFQKITAAFTSDNPALAEECICDIFFSFGMTGVECRIPIDEPDEGFGTHTLALPSENAIVGYMAQKQFSDGVRDDIRHRFQNLEHAGIQVELRVDTVDDQQWAEAWKQHFHVMRITDRIVVKPAWEPFDPGPDDVVIHLDPGMAFGTGTHPSTCMCLKQMQDCLVPGQIFLDVGCGSGILMIAAARLGASKLTGIDTDPAAVDIARENLEKNKIPKERYHLYKCTLDQIPPVQYDLIAANIIAQTIVNIMADIKKKMAPKGLAVLSGIIRERMPDVKNALYRHGLAIKTQMSEDEWVTLTVASDNHGPNPAKNR